MPYGSLGHQPFQPISSLIGGIQAGQQFQRGSLQEAAARQQLEDMQSSRAALKEYGQTNDLSSLMKADPITAMKVTAQQMQIANAAADYWDNTKAGLTRESYPAWRDETIKRFPGIPANQFPPAEQFKSDKEFEGWKYQKEIMAAKFKAMQQGPKVLKGGDILAGPGGNVLAQAPLTPLQEAQALKARTGAQKDIVDIQEPGRKWKPELIFPQSGKGAGIWIKPGDSIPEGYAPMKGMGSKMTYDNKVSLVEGIEDGTIPPSMLSKRAGDYNEILAIAKGRGVNLGKRQTEFEGAKRFASSMNSNQMVRFKGLAGSVVGTIDEVAALTDQLKQSGIKPLNKVALEAKINLAGNTPEGQLATRYVTAVNTLKEEFANLAQGGYAPTEAVWALANRQINENYGVDQMKVSLKEVQRLINYRIKAFDELEPMTGKGTKQSVGSQDLLSGVNPVDYQNFLNGLNNPATKEAALEKAKSVPGGEVYIKQATKDGHL